MGKDQRPVVQTQAEPDFWGEIDASYAASNIWGRIAYWVVFGGGMAVVYAVASTLIYGSPLGPLRPKEPPHSVAAPTPETPPAG